MWRYLDWLNWGTEDKRTGFCFLERTRTTSLVWSTSTCCSQSRWTQSDYCHYSPLAVGNNSFQRLSDWLLRHFCIHSSCASSRRPSKTHPAFSRRNWKRRDAPSHSGGWCREVDWEAGRNDVGAGSGLGHCAHHAAAAAAAAGLNPAAVEPPLEPYAGQEVRAAAARRLHGLAAGRGDLPVAVSGERRTGTGIWKFNCLLIVWRDPQIPATCADLTRRAQCKRFNPFYFYFCFFLFLPFFFCFFFLFFFILLQPTVNSPQSNQDL